VRQILASATSARDADPAQVALWAIALGLTPPFLVAVRKVIDYPFLLRAPAEYVDRVVLGDRLFFMLYGMLATALITALVWDSLSPTRHDHEVTGALPVRPRTVAAARLCAAVLLLGGFSLAITLPSAVLYSAASAVHPLVGAFPRVLVAHVLTSVMGCAFVFGTLLAVRSLLIVCVGDAMASRVAALLQAGTFVLLVQVFFFLPGILPRLLRGLELPAYAAAPPLWYLGLFTWLGEGRILGDGMAARACQATGSALAAAIVTGLVPAGLLRRRAIEHRAGKSAGIAVRIARAAARVLVRAQPVRALLVFAVASLVRSRRHVMILATYGGLAIAASLLGVATAVARGALALNEPRAGLLAIPLVTMYFAVIGLRTASTVPVDLDANWPLRMRQLQVGTPAAATRLFLLVLGVFPVTAGAGVVAAWLWGPMVAVVLGLLQVAAGLFLVEIALSSWTTVPFASAHEPAVATLRSRWAWHILAVLFFGYALAGVEAACLPSVTATAALLGALVWCFWCAARRGRRRRALRVVTYEPVSESIETLRLSPAID
jgi:hypothetical protein